MEKIIFNQEEKKKIEDAMQFVINDILKLWYVVSDVTNELSINIYNNLDDSDYSLPTIILNSEGIKLTQYLCPEKDFWLYRNKSVEMKSKKRLGFWNKKVNDKSDEGHDIDYCLYYTFIKSYKYSSGKYSKSIRDKIIEKITEVCASKENTMGKVNDILKDYDKSASVEIYFNSQNQQKFEVSYEDGRCVGVINFNGNIMKIVTNGEINVVDRPSSIVKKK